MNKNLEAVKAAVAQIGIELAQINLSVVGLGYDFDPQHQLQVIDPEGMECLSGYSNWSIGILDAETYEYGQEVELPAHTDPRLVAFEIARIVTEVNNY